ncbi:hypothetical protein [Amycolatopsis sp. cmx-4-68]|uniref:hypothetical protein n=1 Tax=Amycolatopsis sp. cmx-4-68 TaxID=2790938 RepID=UPI003979F0E6
MADSAQLPNLDTLVPELALVRETGFDALELEQLLVRVPQLAALGVVRRRTAVTTSLGTATTLVQVVREATERLSAADHASSGGGQISTPAQAQMLFRVHYKTQQLSVGAARATTQQASGVADRQYRARHEPRLLRLVAQAVLELDRDDDLAQWGKALEAGVDVPQSVALYWLELFRDHYFRLETSAYALQFDAMTALSQLRNGLPSWSKYLSTAIYWNVEFSFLRQRFFLRHGPLWFAITDEGCEQLADSVERIEYHDPYPDELMAKLRRLYGAAGVPDHDDFERRVREAGLYDIIYDKAEQWLKRCACPAAGEPAPRCEVHLVLKHCELLGKTVEAEFTRIQEWYRNPRFAVNESIAEFIRDFRTPGKERASDD